MKTSIIFFVGLFFSSQTFPQADIKVLKNHFVKENINHKSFYSKQILAIPKSTTLNNFDLTIVRNNTILSNGFLLSEELKQFWVNNNWINDLKTIYIYDVHNNRIEYTEQNWEGSNWVNFTKYTFAYDVNNNMIEWLRQKWDGVNWINDETYIFSYIVAGIEQFTNDIKEYSLSNNFPNPFNPSTKINYQIQELSFVTLKVFDVLGNKIATLVNEEKPAGSYKVVFDRNGLPSGVYFYQLQAGDFIQTKKMVLLC